MASLPSQHPYLALHMTDRATNPLISSSQSHLQPPQQKYRHRQRHRQRQQIHQDQHNRQATTFSTSPPPSSPSSPSSSVDEPPLSPATKQATALAHLSTTALLSYDAAKRLDRGAPLRTMVEHPDGGPVVLHSYMCPMRLALGIPGRNLSFTSLHTAGAGSSPGPVHGGDEDDVGGRLAGSDSASRANEGRDSDHGGRSTKTRRRSPTRPLPLTLHPVSRRGGDDDETDDGDTDVIDPRDPPMLTSTVVAPRTEDLREARRAAARLERVARVFQTEWTAAGGGGGNSG